MEFTESQHEAIYTHDSNLIVVAGAGSGKTRVLVERYLALLDTNPDWSLGALVAITFTKKAAEEMRDRVRKALEDRCFRVTLPDELERWSRLLSEIDSARIDTIHGLCATILRANAAEAGIDPDFVVLDEVEASVLLDDVIDLVLSDLATSELPAVELLTEYDAREVRNVLRGPDLLAAGMVHQSVDAAALVEQWQGAWRSSIGMHLRMFVEQVETVELFEPVEGDLLGETWRLCQKCLETVCKENEEMGWQALQEICMLSTKGGTQKAWGDKETLSAAREALTTIRAFARTLKDMIGEPPGELDRRAARLLPHWTMLMRAVQASYAAAKANLSALDFDDLERKTCDLLQRYPDVQRRYRGAEFKHVLVDEFQDTNAAQWQIVQALTGLDMPGSLFVVGDPKQSIYAFRGADVSVFGSVFEQITVNGKDTNLAKSFRTHQPLVNGFNEIFRKLLVRDSVDPLVSGFQVEFGMAMEAFRENPPDGTLPAMELLLIDQYEYDEQGRSLGEKLKAEERREWEACEIAQRIHTMVQDGRLIHDKEKGRLRPIQYDDVAILFQSLGNVTLYEEVFKAMGLPFITLAGRGYYDRQEVWDLLNLLQALYNPADNLSLASVLRSPMFGLSDDALLALRLSGRKQISDDAEETDERGMIVDLWEALGDPGDLLPDSERQAVDFARECLAYLRSIAGRVTISELLREALQRTGYLAILTGLPDGARRRGNVEKLLDKAETSGKTTLGAFSQYLRDLSTREVREGEAAVDVAGAVQIMTVHASKGLEFPVVVLADASWDRGSSNRDCVVRDPEFGFACKVYDPEQGKSVPTYRFRVMDHIAKQREAAERLRLLYVAATRAQDYLLVCGQVQDSKGVWRSNGWLGRLLDVLDLTNALSPCMDMRLDYAWGQIQLTLPRCRPDDNLFAASTTQVDWDIDWSSIQLLKPELIADVPVQLEMQARHLAATHIADLGSAELDTDDRWFYRQRFKRQVLQDVPTVIEWVSQAERRPSARQVGEMVHEALRHWRIPGQGDDASLHEMLYSYAWRQGITDEVHCKDAARRAYRLLLDFKHSDMFHWVESAQAVYRELPFVYERQGYIIHGIIDVLFRMPDGRWIIADYKTSTVKPSTSKAITQHAQRYYLQLGVYADAVQNHLDGMIPEAYIHYIRYAQTVQVTEAAWRGALSRSLTERILALFEGQ